MILHIQIQATSDQIQAICETLNAFHVRTDSHHVVVGSSSLKSTEALSPELQKLVSEQFVFDNDLQLGSKKYIQGTREVSFGEVTLGGNSANTLMITGPCAVESEEQIDKSAAFLLSQGVKVLRAGCFKPRTSPYSFQGLGMEGLKLLVKMREKYGLQIITEVKDATHVEAVIEHSDIVQVGAKAMYDQGILRACAKADKTVLIKRGFGSTLQEFVQAAEFVLMGGNHRVMLCERGIRTFEKGTRFTLDLCGVAWLKAHSNLPLILDPSHAMGYRYGIADLTRACVAMGVDGLLIETHPTPEIAKSDAAQQLNFAEFEAMFKTLPVVAKAVGRTII